MKKLASTLWIVAGLLGVAVAQAQTQAPTNTSAPRATRSQAAAHAKTQAAAAKSGEVWVNGGIYHCPGSRYYGKTKKGQYMTEARAKATGARVANNKPCEAARQQK